MCYRSRAERWPAEPLAVVAQRVALLDEVDAALGQVGRCVGGDAVDPDFEVDMRSERVAAVAGQRDELTAIDVLSFVDEQRGGVRVDKLYAVADVDDHRVPIPAIPPGHRDRAA